MPRGTAWECAPNLHRAGTHKQLPRDSRLRFPVPGESLALTQFPPRGPVYPYLSVFIWHQVRVRLSRTTGPAGVDSPRIHSQNGHGHWTEWGGPDTEGGPQHGQAQRPGGEGAGGT